MSIPNISDFPAPQAPSPISVLIVQGQNAEQEGRVQDAFNAYTQAIELNPKNPRSLLCRARLISDHPNLDQDSLGLDDAMGVIALKQNSPEPFLIRCKIFARKRQPWAILCDASGGLALHKNNPDLLLYRAKSYLQSANYIGPQSRFKYAKDDLSNLLAQNPSNRAECLLLRAQAHFGLNLLEEALQDLSEVLQTPLKEEALPLFEQTIQSILAKAETLQKEGKLDEAYNEVVKVLIQAPTHNAAATLFASLGEQISSQSHIIEDS